MAVLKFSGFQMRMNSIAVVRKFLVWNTNLFIQSVIKNSHFNCKVLFSKFRVHSYQFKSLKNTQKRAFNYLLDRITLNVRYKWICSFNEFIFWFSAILTKKNNAKYKKTFTMLSIKLFYCETHTDQRNIARMQCFLFWRNVNDVLTPFCMRVGVCVVCIAAIHIAVLAASVLNRLFNSGWCSRTAQVQAKETIQTHGSNEVLVGVQITAWVLTVCVCCSCFIQSPYAIFSKIKADFWLIDQ